MSSVDLFLFGQCKGKKIFKWGSNINIVRLKTDLSLQYFSIHAVIGLEYLLCFLLRPKNIYKRCSYIF